MPTHRIRHLSKQLPRTSCSPVIYEKIIAIADQRGVSIAEVQREALSLFLASVDNKVVGIASNSIKRQERKEA